MIILAVWMGRAYGITTSMRRYSNIVSFESYITVGWRGRVTTNVGQ